MTRAEAAEVILSEDPVFICTACNGSGTRVSGDGNWIVQCWTCSASGRKMNSRYVKACQLLNLPVPKFKEDWDDRTGERPWE